MTPLAGAVLGLPLALAAERDILRLPAAVEFRLQRIARAGNEAGRPFGVEGGHPACARAAGDGVKPFAPCDGLDELVARVAPYVATARRPCDRPPGTQIEAGEL